MSVQLNTPLIAKLAVVEQDHFMLTFYFLTGTCRPRPAGTYSQAIGLRFCRAFPGHAVFRDDLLSPSHEYPSGMPVFSHTGS